MITHPISLFIGEKLRIELFSCLFAGVTILLIAIEKLLCLVGKYAAAAAFAADFALGECKTEHLLGMTDESECLGICEEAYTLNQKKSNRVIGGMIWLKMETLNVGTAIDLSGLGLDTIEETETEFRIGAMASLRALELHEGLAAYTNGAMRESVRHIVGVQLRNLATVGGSLYSRFGFSDVLTMFLVLDAQVELYKGGIVPLSKYAESPKDRDILVRIIVPKKNAKFNYQSVRISQTDIPVLTCASVKDENGYRFAIGARPARAQIYAQPVDKTAEQMAEAVRAEIKTGSSLRGSAEYRRHLAGVLVRRAAHALDAE
jgi:CO/xanthine dehydrogenase FAD-binding subunit